jgi:2-dehydro-3-deoxyphosphogluconate aldolase/(4S)-4-hydroxy-2-oxoglutarate aldolase
MVRPDKQIVINKIVSLGLVPVFYEGNIEKAKKIVTACVNGGAHIVEYTNRGDLAFQVFANLGKWIHKEYDDVILGAGSIIEEVTAGIYINSGANFVVGPILNKEIAKLCNRRKIPYIPGCSTATEISTAEELGCEIIKIFPASCIGGPSFIKSILGPLPWVKLMPTGGVNLTQKEIFSWIESGATALGIGSKLIRKDLLKDSNYKEISKNIEKCLSWINDARKKR